MRGGIVGESPTFLQRPNLAGDTPRQARSFEEKERPRTPTRERCERATSTTTDLSGSYGRRQRAKHTPGEIFHVRVAWSWPTLAKPTLANFSVQCFWPNFLVLLLWWWCGCVVVVVVVVVAGTTFRRTPPPPKISLFLFLSHHHFALFVSLWVSSR